MKISSIAVSALAGVAGAVAVVLLHRALRTSLYRYADVDRPGTLADLRMAGALVSNGLYYGLAGALGRDRALATGAVLGVAAGVGSVMLPPRLGLRARPQGSPAMQAAEVGMHATGGLVAGATYRLLGN